MSEETEGGSNPLSRRGLWFEDYRAGQTYVSQGRTLTEADVVSFAGLSGDFTSLHTDAEYAKRTPFRRRVAHGLLVQAIATGLMTRTGLFEGTILALSDMVTHWRAPVFLGDTIRLRLQVESLDTQPSKRAGQVRFSACVLNQADQVVVEGEWGTLVARRPQASGEGSRGERDPATSPTRPSARRSGGLSS